MLFSSLTFLCLFLPLALAAVFAAPPRWRNAVLLAESLLFYAWGAPKFVFALVAGCVVDYMLARAILRSRSRLALWAGIALNLGVLCLFKYGDAALGPLNRLFGAAGLPALARIALPLGLSFVTFQKISYLVDVYRGTVRPASTFRDYLLYILLFPQLVIGPIIRYHDIADQIRSRTVRSEGFLSGLWRFSVGLARKMLLANPLSAVADQAFASAASLSAPEAWIGLYAYTLQIFFDFAGYSDMAIGLGRMLGFRFLENFDAPYLSRDMAEFWRRWHISLGNFMKEYLYIPLGGNRVSLPRFVLNGWIVFLLSGLWHGETWNFLVWGAWHGLWISVASVPRILAKRRGVAPGPDRHAFLRIAATFLLVMLGWVFFRSATLPAALAYFRALVPAHAAAGMAHVAVSPQSLAALLAGTFLAFAPAWLPRLSFLEWEVPDAAPHASRLVLLRSFATAALIALSSLPLLLSGFSPFIYNRF